ncbi:uncharacterized protein J7T54_007777 [Emericellopsis cladophorae]|uniref:EthD domain-containing protein n=1 Tax=Emericellopsis cladophorae TaxID=2686198 RepID=A0A9P9XXI5_9HYPO|nr:uncharacterized protein J7T54_007777 [Emericellopsis cladophorae]KAI6779250.1 hypothetical protein J7T54_007777 [Emericellopsis cladophorae]
MVYRIIVLAPRKAGVTHEDFKARYEQHMHLVEDICGRDLMPLRHTRSYIRHDVPGDKPVLLAGRAEDVRCDAVVNIDFEDEAAFQRFIGALSTEDARARIDADEAGFWDRTGMKVVVVEGIEETQK